MQKIEAAQFEDLFEQRLQKYDQDRKQVSEEREEQEDIAARLREANTAFANARKGDTSSRERERALQRLENAFFKYKEIVGNLDTGRKFYNDLAKIVNKFRDECRDFRYQRRMEASQLEKSVCRLNFDDCGFNLRVATCQPPCPQCPWRRQAHCRTKRRETTSAPSITQPKQLLASQ